MDSIVKCACGHEDCRVEIQIVDGEHLRFVDGNGQSTTMVVNTGSLNFLISHLRKVRNEELGIPEWET